MCTMSVIAKDSYVTLSLKNKKISYLVSPALTKYTAVKSFNKETGVLSLSGQFRLANGESVTDDDWIDLNEELAFAFKEPKKLISEIDTILLV